MPWAVPIQRHLNFSSWLELSVQTRYLARPERLQKQTFERITVGLPPTSHVSRVRRERGNDPNATWRIMSYGPSGRYRSQGLGPHCLLHIQDQLAAHLARFAFGLGLGGILDGHALDLGQLDRSLHQQGRQLA